MTPPMLMLIVGVFGLVLVGTGMLLFTVLERLTPERRRLAQLATPFAARSSR